MELGISRHFPLGLISGSYKNTKIAWRGREKGGSVQGESLVTFSFMQGIRKFLLEWIRYGFVSIEEEGSCNNCIMEHCICCTNFKRLLMVCPGCTLHGLVSPEVSVSLWGPEEWPVPIPCLWPGSKTGSTHLRILTLQTHFKWKRHITIFFYGKQQKVSFSTFNSPLTCIHPSALVSCRFQVTTAQ